jgi:hypothetical protein
MAGVFLAKVSRPFVVGRSLPAPLIPGGAQRAGVGIFFFLFVKTKGARLLGRIHCGFIWKYEMHACIRMLIGMDK